MPTKSQAIASLLLTAICSSMLVQTDLSQLPPRSKTPGLHPPPQIPGLPIPESPRDLIQCWSTLTSIPGCLRLWKLRETLFMEFGIKYVGLPRKSRERMVCHWRGSWRRPLAVVPRACDAIGEEPSVTAPRSLGMMAKAVTAILLVEILASNP
ncbi:hypothetical protein SADUNF_Sadunf06G0148400 [Salix dunnii]|uniref:Uncharacterized protein n=1 Tax=Salix dunnii TaxID=1413687 RepID=A0A835K7E3_9ROSI|nr:hypothetical protein SADUNF_Sadunf06G0148400 [Salix dunnii]